MKISFVKALCSYAKSRLPAAAVLAGLLVFMAFVYGLYGLPAGPAVYTALLLLSAVGLVALADFGLYRKKLAALAQLRNSTGALLPHPPGRYYALEKEYWELLKLCRAQQTQAEETALKAAEDSARYYTLWSHQIKTPLAAMRLLLQEAPADRSALNQELLRADRYVDMALQYQRLGDTRDLVLAEYPLEQLVHRAVRRLSPFFIRKKLSLELEPIRARVLTDEKWLVFVLEQLLSNAVKYTSAGGVKVEYDEESQTLSIRDTGMGILPEDLPRVFEWGYTGMTGRTDGQSTGIGLFLCCKTTDLLGYGLRLESRPGQGTCALLTLRRPRFDIE